MSCDLKINERWPFLVPRFNKRIMSFAALTRTLRLRLRAAYADRYALLVNADHMLVPVTNPKE